MAIKEGWDWPPPGAALCHVLLAPSWIACFTGVACGGAHTAAVAEDGSAYLWGLNDRGQLAQGDETPFLQVLVSPSEGLIATHPMCGQDRAACRVNNAQCHPVHHRMVHHSVAGEQR